MTIKHKIISKLKKIVHIFGFTKLETSNEFIKYTAIEEYLDKKINQVKKNDPFNLCGYEYQVFSQNGEDGILQEIFNRIGTSNKYFVEFGVGDGIENNTASLLLNGWKGSWIEGSDKNNAIIQKKLSKLLKSEKLNLLKSFITKNNIIDHFQNLEIPKDFDLLSIDIDGNDYWVWKALKDYSPRVVVIEYNGSLGPHLNWTMPYDENHMWGGKTKGNYFGASLKALELLGNDLGYHLVGTNLSGVNAFFIRKDLVDEKLFNGPYTSESTFNKPLYFLGRRLGHLRNHEILDNISN
mgnify:CR=1 FL=1|tara:strand:- start:2943 stop:3827 length:885 start_codon:yes stop_codon:yes gene_type:complete